MTDRRPEWMRALRRLVRNSAPVDPAVPVSTFGTVRGLNPLRVALDTDPATTLNYEPPCLEYPTAIGQRFWAQTYGRQVVIIGISKAAPDLPVGSAGIWSGPVGKEPQLPWMLMEGQLLPRSEYPELSALYGSTFPGSNATHVALPNATGRTVVHREAGSSQFGTIGQHFGSKDETLTVVQMPSHTHTQDPHAHPVRYRQSSAGAGSSLHFLRRNAASDDYDGTDSDAAMSVTATNKNTGGGQSHNNIQPSLTLRYMVKVR